jgi:hypothetical protein
MNLDRLMQLLRPQDSLQAATSPMTSPQLGMLNRMLGLAQGQAQTAIEQTPQKLAESQALLSQYDPKQPIDPKLLDQFMNLAGWGAAGTTKPAKTIVTEFSKAMKEAQKNAAKPINEGGLGLPKNNTAADRAAAMGFDTRVFHGTADDFSTIDPFLFGKTTKARTAKEAFWVTDSPDVARTYAEYAAKNAKVEKLVDKAFAAEKKGDWNLYDDYLRQAEELEAAFAKEYGSGQTIMPFLLKRGQMGQKDMQGRSFDDFGVSDEIFERIVGAKKYDKLSGIEFKNLNDAIGRANLPATHFAVTDPTAIRSIFAAFDPMKSKSGNILAGMFPLTYGLGLLEEDQ